MTILQELSGQLSEQNTIIGISIILAVLIAFYFIKKLFKMAIVILVILILYASFLYYSGKEHKEISNEIIEKGNEVKIELEQKFNEILDTVVKSIQK